MATFCAAAFMKHGCSRMQETGDIYFSDSADVAASVGKDGYYDLMWAFKMVFFQVPHWNPRPTNTHTHTHFPEGPLSDALLPGMANLCASRLLLHLCLRSCNFVDLIRSVCTAAIEQLIRGRRCKASESGRNGTALQGKPSGRILKYSPSARTTTIVADGFW